MGRKESMREPLGSENLGVRWLISYCLLMQKLFVYEKKLKKLNTIIVTIVEVLQLLIAIINIYVGFSKKYVRFED